MKNLTIASLTLGAALSTALVGGAVTATAEELATTPANRMSVPLAPDAPSTYVVQRGDTLWDISGRFLTQPWYWPEIWYVNPEIKNPHLIYPGDTLRLVYGADGRPQIRVERGNAVVLSPQVRTQPLSQAIPAIPYEIVAAFMSKPSVLTREDAERLPYVVATREGKMIGGMGDTIYGRGVDGAPGTRYNVVHLGDKLKDPDDGDFLGYQGIYAGMARVDRAGTGDRRDDSALAKLTLVESARETLQGDRLVVENLEVPLDFVPHAPSQPVDGEIMSVVDGVSTIGQYQVVVINRGKRHGLEPGHVLQVWQSGAVTRDYGPSKKSWTRQVFRPFGNKVQLPSEKAGLFMVFRVYDRLSYGLVVSADTVLGVGDRVKAPDAGI
jgi:hypothetical protein